MIIPREIKLIRTGTILRYEPNQLLYIIWEVSDDTHGRLLLELSLLNGSSKQKINLRAGYDREPWTFIV